MTKKELQKLINFLVEKLRDFEEAYKELSDEVSNVRLFKDKFHDMWKESEQKARRRNKLLIAINHILDEERYYEEDQTHTLNEIGLIIDKWHEQEDEQYED